MMTKSKSEFLKEILSSIDYNTKNATRVYSGRDNPESIINHIVIDWYSPTILITMYQEDLDTESELKVFAEANNIPIQLSIRGQYSTDWKYFYKKIEEVITYENEIQYIIRFHKSQNVGFFLDFKHIREYLLKNSKDKKVLNLFSYTCSLSVAACLGGAREVFNIDLSKSSLTWGRKNHEINNIKKGLASYKDYDVIKSLNKFIKKGPYDLVICDPPAKQFKNFIVERDYPKIIRKLSSILTPETGKAIIALNARHLSLEDLRTTVEENSELKMDQNLSLSELNTRDSLKTLLYHQ